MGPQPQREADLREAQDMELHIRGESDVDGSDASSMCPSNETRLFLKQSDAVNNNKNVDDDAMGFYVF